MGGSSPEIVGRASAHFTRTAIIDATRSYTYRELDASSACVARHLLGNRRDLQEARVAFLISPGFEHVAVQWGIWRAGAVAVPLPVTHPAAELDYLIRDAGAAFVVLRVAPAEPPSYKRNFNPADCRNRFRAALLGA